jgi:hypothetical protein
MHKTSHCASEPFRLRVTRRKAGQVELFLRRRLTDLAHWTLAVKRRKVNRRTYGSMPIAKDARLIKEWMIDYLDSDK